MKIEAVAPRLFRAAWKVASISRSASSESSNSALHLPCCLGQDVWLDHVAAALEVERESEGFLQAAGALRQKGLLDRVG